MPKRNYDVMSFIQVLKAIAKDRKVAGRTRLAAADRIAHLAQFYTVDLKAQENEDDLLKKYKEKHEGGVGAA